MRRARTQYVRGKGGGWEGCGVVCLESRWRAAYFGFDALILYAPGARTVYAYNLAGEAVRAAHGCAREEGYRGHGQRWCC